MNPLAGKSLVILNTSDETIELLKSWFEERGMVVHGATVTEFRKNGGDLPAFIAAAAPAAVIFDIALPYAANWRYLQEQCRDVCAGSQSSSPRPTSPRSLPSPASRDPEVAHEILGEPADLEALTAKVIKQISPIV